MFISKKKIFFPRTRTPISIKLGTNHPWVKGILDCSNTGPGPHQRGDNNKVQKFGEVIEFSSLKTTDPE
jgi:hypothetical protein